MWTNGVRCDNKLLKSHDSTVLCELLRAGVWRSFACIRTGNSQTVALPLPHVHVVVPKVFANRRRRGGVCLVAEHLPYLGRALSFVLGFAPGMRDYESSCRVTDERKTLPELGAKLAADEVELVRLGSLGQKATVIIWPQLGWYIFICLESSDKDPDIVSGVFPLVEFQCRTLGARGPGNR